MGDRVLGYGYEGMGDRVLGYGLCGFEAKDKTHCRLKKKKKEKKRWLLSLTLNCVHD